MKKSIEAQSEVKVGHQPCVQMDMSHQCDHAKHVYVFFDFFFKVSKNHPSPE